MPKPPHRILLIDDHLLFAEGLKAQLVKLTAAANISILNDGSQFVRQLSFTEDYDLYIFDLSMPDIDGFDLIRKLIAHNPLARILVISAASELRLAEQAMELGAKGFVSKAANPDTMLEGVGAILNGEQFFDPGLNRSNEAQATVSDDGLTIPPRTKEVLKHMSKGHANKSIADLLSITEATVKWHVSRLFVLLGVNNRTGCVAKAVRLGLVEID